MVGFTDHNFKQVLKNEGVFIELDRLSGRHLSIFYFHTGGRKAIMQFNSELISRLGIEHEIYLPCVVFFKLADGGVANISVVTIESDDPITGFQELYSVIEKYICADGAVPNNGSKLFRWIRSAVKFVSLDVLHVGIKAAVGRIVP